MVTGERSQQGAFAARSFFGQPQCIATRYQIATSEPAAHEHGSIISFGLRFNARCVVPYSSSYWVLAGWFY